MIHKLLRWPTISLATLLHASWAILLVFDARAIHVTTLFPFNVASVEVFILILVGTVVLAVWAMTRMEPSFRTLLALLPQQALLVISSVGAIYAMVVGHYGDGVLRPHAFLIADQLLIVFLTLMHAYCVVRMHQPYVGDEGD